MKLADLERHLRQQGCVVLREGGAHTVWFNPQRRKITSVPRHREIKEGTVRAICKQLEIPYP
jgi:predicted RNA binding protein YcfA (HicA-like mRNA interferase family)